MPLHSAVAALTRQAEWLPDRGHWGLQYPQLLWKQRMGAISPLCPGLPCPEPLSLQHRTYTWSVMICYQQRARLLTHAARLCTHAKRLAPPTRT